MISKNTIKLIKSLTQKKFRNKEQLFLVEGDKNVVETLNSGFIVDRVFATNSFISKHISDCNKATELIEVEHSEIKKASLLQNPQNSLAICKLPSQKKLPELTNKNLSIFLDDIQDPGNLGTIIRICDWFRIEYLFCSPNTVDMYNPKVIQASMGSFCRIQTYESTFKEIKNLATTEKIPIYGAFLEGKNIYQEALPENAILVMGNEGNGIQKEIEEEITEKIRIPSFTDVGVGAESLNVSVATSIICSEFKRNQFV